MEKYELYYFDSLIANFYIDENNNLSYIPYEENIRKFGNQILVILHSKKSCCIDEFPFLKSRISNMKNFNLNTLKYNTDNYLIKKL